MNPEIESRASQLVEQFHKVQADLVGDTAAINAWARICETAGGKALLRARLEKIKRLRDYADRQMQIGSLARRVSDLLEPELENDLKKGFE